MFADNTATYTVPAELQVLNAQFATVTFTRCGRVAGANHRFLSMSGYALEEILGSSGTQLFGAASSAWDDLLDGEYSTVRFPLKAKDGGRIPLKARCVLVPDAADVVVMIAEEISDQEFGDADYQWQIAAIRRSHAVITLDMHGAILEANRQFLDLMGYSLDEIRGSHHRILLPTSMSHGADYAAFWRELRSGHHHAGQYKRISKDGSEVWLQATYNPIFDINGMLARVVCYATAITDERMRQAENQGQIAAISQAQCVISFALDGTILDANENFLAVFGYKYADLRGKNHRMIVDADTGATAAYTSFWESLAAGYHQAGEFKRLGREGREIWLQATYNPILDMNGKPFKIIKYAVDITAEKLRQADYQGQIEAINKSQGVLALALDGTILEINDNFLDTLGYEREEIVGKHHRMLIEPGAAGKPEYGAFWDTLRSGQYHAGLYKRIGKDGRELWIQASYNPILDLNGKPVKVIKFATDVTANIALAEAFSHAEREAQHDAATSLPNRVKLANFMTEHLSRADAKMTVFYIDLDRFKPVNDTFGHHVGDKVLRETADRLLSVVGSGHIVARIGGDEFVIAAPDFPAEQIDRFCRRLVSLISKPIDHDGNRISISLSIGVAIAPADATTPDELLQCADAALYRSKQNGRGTYSIFSADVNEAVACEQQLADEMRQGLAVREFVVEYQPRFDTHERSIRSVEALIRWDHPKRGRIGPTDFVVAAEHNGLITPLGEWVLRTACRVVSQWDGIGVSVNISPAQLRDANFVETVRSALEASGLAGRRLELELTEDALVRNIDRAETVLGDLKALGVRLALDNFGTGPSSLSHLRDFAFDVIKIDRRLIASMESDQGARRTVQAIIALAEALEISVTATGVETNAQLAMLTREQCREVQGFLLAHPLPASRLKDLLAKLPELIVQAQAA